MTAIEFCSKGASYKLIDFRRLSIMIFCPIWSKTKSPLVSEFPAPTLVRLTRQDFTPTCRCDTGGTLIDLAAEA